VSAPDTPGVIAPPPLIYLGLFLAGWGLSQILPDPGLGIGWDVRRYLAFALIAGGIVIDGAAAGRFRRLGTAVQPWKPTTALATDGLYRFTRNPIYVGFALIYLGLTAAVDSLAALVLLPLCLVVVDRFVIAREERYLAAKFGPEYDAYRRKVRRWL
jgi:protein-S-isoprenylcysteine O-methyltransferase Ste14